MYTLRFRRGTAVAWAASNPILEAGEPGLETDTKKYKVGDGSTPWLDLPAYADEAAVRQIITDTLGTTDGQDPTSLPAHVLSPTPHPAYDDIQDLTLLFENGLL